MQYSGKLKKGFEEHGCLNVLTNSVKKEEGLKNVPSEKKAELEKQIKDNLEPITVRYHNYRGSHEHLVKPYCAGAGHPIQQWKFLCGEVYTVPKGLVKEVNEKRCRLPKRSEILDPNGQPTVKDGSAEIIHEMLPVIEGL